MHTLDDAQLCLLLQWLDSGYPNGGFAHSNGLEAALQAREAESVDDLVRLWSRQQLRLGLPFVVAAWREPDDVGDLNVRLSAVLTNHVARRASLAQGDGLWTATQRVFGSDVAGPGEIGKGHHAVTFGALARRLGFSLELSAMGFGFVVARGLMAAAVRLGVYGPFLAQRSLSVLLADARLFAASAPAMTLDDAVQISPLGEIWQATHDRLYSRLFLS